MHPTVCLCDVIQTSYLQHTICMLQVLSEESDIVILQFVRLGFLPFQGKFVIFLELVRFYKGAIIMTKYVLFIEQKQYGCLMNCSPCPQRRTPWSPGPFTETLNETEGDFPAHLLEHLSKDKSYWSHVLRIQFHAHVKWK